MLRRKTPSIYFLYKPVPEDPFYDKIEISHIEF